MISSLNNVLIFNLSIFSVEEVNLVVTSDVNIENSQYLSRVRKQDDKITENWNFYLIPVID